VGKLPRLRIFGNDYDTPDGTGVRDYLHVVDLASGHLRALEKIFDLSFPHSSLSFPRKAGIPALCIHREQRPPHPVPRPGPPSPCLVYNLGTGRGYSVLEMVKAFEKASSRTIPYEIASRRPGDIAAVFADPTLAKRDLNWTATRDLAAMCADTWRWQSMNPNGYEAPPKKLLA